MANEYGKRYPGSGTTPPFRGGPDHHEMPKGMIEKVPVTETRTHTERPGLIGRLLGRPDREVTEEVVVGEKIKKHYR